jgi:hypothetical protein
MKPKKKIKTEAPAGEVMAEMQVTPAVKLL